MLQHYSQFLRVLRMAFGSSWQEGFFWQWCWTVLREAMTPMFARCLAISPICQPLFPSLLCSGWVHRFAGWSLPYCSCHCNHVVAYSIRGEWMRDAFWGVLYRSIHTHMPPHPQEPTVVICLPVWKKSSHCSVHTVFVSLSSASLQHHYGQNQILWTRLLQAKPGMLLALWHTIRLFFQRMKMHLQPGVWWWRKKG